DLSQPLAHVGVPQEPPAERRAAREPATVSGAEILMESWVSGAQTATHTLPRPIFGVSAALTVLGVARIATVGLAVALASVELPRLLLGDAESPATPSATASAQLSPAAGGRSVLQQDAARGSLPEDMPPLSPEAQPIHPRALLAEEVTRPGSPAHSLLDMESSAPLLLVTVASHA